MKHLMEDWLAEYDIPQAAANPDPVNAGAGGASPLGTGPGGFNNPKNPQGFEAGNNPDITDQMPQQDQPDVSQDPATPDMPEEQEEMSFDQWRNKFFKESVKGDAYDLENLLKQMEHRDLNAYEEKFVRDNLQIVQLRQNANIKIASQKIRKLVKDELDQNNPSSSIANHLNEVLKTMPELVNIFVKMIGLGDAKGGAHRKYIASLLGAVQVGSGANTEDLIYNEREFSIAVSTRFNSEFGDVMLGRWSIKQDDPEKFLEDAELQRMEEGSPEEKDVLRRRIVMESIAEQFKRRAFVINSVDTDGNVYLLGWDIPNCLKTGYKEGKLVVKAIKSDNLDAMIDDSGAIIPQMDLKINYMKPTGKLDSKGEREHKEIPFIEKRDGLLFLSADLKILKEAAATLQGICFHEWPYTGNPTDVKALMKCVPSISELLLRSA